MINKNLAILVLCTAFIGTAQAATIGSSAKLFGNQAPEAYAARTVTLGGKTNQIIVASGETVTFRAGSQSVNWTFLESIEPQAVNLSVLFPDLEGAKNVWVYIQPSEIYKAG